RRQGCSVIPVRVCCKWHSAREIQFCGCSASVGNHSKGTSCPNLGPRQSTKEEIEDCSDPLEIPEVLSRDWHPIVPEDLPRVFTGGWVGYCGYDTVRYVYEGKLPFSNAPRDDRNIPDMHLALYSETVLFDHATKLAYAVSWVRLDEFDNLERICSRTKKTCIPDSPAAGASRLGCRAGGFVYKRPEPKNSNFTEDEFMEAIAETKEHILSGDVFQLVLSQRFERTTFADPFEVYRALRVVNPSPYMAYLNSRESILVSSSPEILCRVEESRRVTNRPLAGTRRRGLTQSEDEELEKDLLQDEKELAEHVMLVDLGRNDVGKVAQAGTVNVDKLMEIERYSHVMHISSTEPKVRAMQILDELEHSKRGPYGGGFGHVSFTGGMDMALALRTMVIPTKESCLYKYDDQSMSARREWTIHLQAGAGVVADSIPENEFEETVNKAAALGRAIDLAESSFIHPLQRDKN
ncbi:Anthranilate synthase alpha subunit 1, partial [Picochlorum sp. SENEW3]